MSSSLYIPPHPSEWLSNILHLHSLNDHNAVLTELHAHQDGSSSSSLCCLRITPHLITSITTHLNSLIIPSSLSINVLNVLSIGSGSGILEWLIQTSPSLHSSITITGCDTYPVNVFLPTSQFIVLNDPKTLTDLSQFYHSSQTKPTCLFSCYIRRSSILATFLSVFTSITCIILLGPKSEDPLSDTAIRDLLFANEEWSLPIPVLLTDSDALKPWDFAYVLHKKKAPK
ncbi:hypothetical protein BC829DRAFT_441019 [Chytridium lagenaria]|nr:hypothetical protein BC829DRAFT_441019 [Chytridium lagenaria]